MNISEVINRNEATVQAEIYRQLKNNGVDCYLEIKIKNPLRKLNSIVDIVVCDDSGEIVYFIEVKSTPKTLKPKKKTTIQEDRYIELCEHYGIPYLYCYGKEQIKDTVRTIIREI